MDLSFGVVMFGNVMLGVVCAIHFLAYHLFTCAM